MSTNKAAADTRAYVTAQPPRARRYLRQIRAIIRTAAPKVTESITYGIPTFKLDGKRFIYCAGFKAHVSLYPMTGAIRRKFATELKRLVKARLAEIRKPAR